MLVVSGITAEDNPRNDYPDEESSEDDEHLNRSSYDELEHDEHEHRSSCDQSEHDELESRSSSYQSEKENYVYEEEIGDDDEDDDRRWEYRWGSHCVCQKLPALLLRFSSCVEFLFEINWYGFLFSASVNIVNCLEFCLSYT